MHHWDLITIVGKEREAGFIPGSFDAQLCHGMAPTNNTTCAELGTYLEDPIDDKNTQ